MDASYILVISSRMVKLIFDKGFCYRHYITAAVTCREPPMRMTLLDSFFDLCPVGVVIKSLGRGVSPRLLLVAFCELLMSVGDIAK